MYAFIGIDMESERMYILEFLLNDENAASQADENKTIYLRSVETNFPVYQF